MIPNSVCIRRENLNRWILRLVAAVVLTVFGVSPDAVAEKASLTAITLEPSPATVRMTVTGNVEGKVIRVDDRELLIALKGLEPVSGLSVGGNGGTLIKHVDVASLAGNVVGVVVTGARPFGPVETVWDAAGKTFRVRLEKAGEKEKIAASARPRVKKPKFIKSPKPQVPEIPVAGGEPSSGQDQNDAQRPAADDRPGVEPGATTSASLASIPAPEVVGLKSYMPPTRESSIYNGDISDLAALTDLSGCDSPGLSGAARLLEQANYEKAFQTFDGEMMSLSEDCLEQVLFLRAYAYYRFSEGSDAKHFLASFELFQDAMVTFPDSRFAPFALAAMGILQRNLENPAAAEGFLTLVRDGFTDYTGIPEVLFHLAEIYVNKGYNDKALDYYKAVFENYPKGRYTVDAGIGLGKSLLEKLHYIDAINILSYLIEANPEKVYDSQELLVNMGNANLKLGRSGQARENLIRAYNLFPDISGRDEILSSVGDTYAMENKPDRAMNIYRFVMDTFPGTEGYVTSAIGLARHLKDRAEREKLYEMVKLDYPEHTMASIAMIRLAEIYETEGEYDRCIEEIEDLLARHPRGLRYEAVKLMQKAYEKLFEKEIKAGENPQVLKRYEKKQELLDRMESRELFLSVGMAYGGAGLYEPSFNQLIKAYKLYKKNQRPPELLLALGIAMDETGRDDDALKVFRGFVDRFPKSPDRTDILSRMGTILFERKDVDTALKTFDKAYAAAGSDFIQKGAVMMKKAEVFKVRHQWNNVSEVLLQATQDFASAPGKNYAMLSESYKGLGESYVEQKLYIKAAEAFSTALTFSDQDQPVGDIGFMLGDAYQKGNVLDKARETFTRVVNTDDSIWSRLAQERLTTLELAGKVQES